VEYESSCVSRGCPRDASARSSHSRAPLPLDTQNLRAPPSTPTGALIRSALSGLREILRRGADTPPAGFGRLARKLTSQAASDSRCTLSHGRTPVRSRSMCCVRPKSVPLRLAWRPLGVRPAKPACRVAFCCVVAWTVLDRSGAHRKLLSRLQAEDVPCRGRGCCGPRRWTTVSRCPGLAEYRDRPWPELLHFWGLPNLQLVNSAMHDRKSVDETRTRAAHRPQQACPAPGVH
jgi:hypothetical protein